MSRLRKFFSLITLLLCYFAVHVKAQVFEKIPELHGDSVVFPITLINAFPFISATVNGIEGKFMFDTGNHAAIDLNDNLVNLIHKKAKGTGVVGSGQSFTKNLNDTIREIKFSNGITYRNLEKIPSGNYDFLQQRITQDCIGYIGHNFFKGYSFKLDYIHRKITFYKNTIERNISMDFLANEKVLTVMDFETRKLPNIPFVNLKIGKIKVPGAFDTGQYGILQLEVSSNSLLKNKRLVLPSGPDKDGDTLLTVKNIVFPGKLKTTLKGVEISNLENSQIIRNALGITEPNLMTIGYRFFSQYKTVWDYDKKKIYILEY